MIPAFLLGKTARFIAITLVVLGVAAVWVKARDNRLKREAIAEERVAKVEAELVFARDSLATAKARTDTVTEVIRVAAQGYTTQRARVDTITRQANIPAGMVVVPIEYVRSADSLAVMVQQLLATVARERIASDSVIALQRQEIEQLKIVIKAGPGIQSRLRDAAIGGAIVFAAVYFLGGKN